MRQGYGRLSVTAAVMTIAWLATAALATRTVSGQTSAKDSRPWALARTLWGDPDLQGVWNYASGTPLERPAQYAGRVTLTDEELIREEARVRERGNGDRRDEGAASLDLNREHNEFWFARRASILSRRTSLIMDPPDGKLPPLTPEAAQGQAAREALQRARGPAGVADSWEDRNLNERCLVNETSGPPILPRTRSGASSTSSSATRSTSGFCRAGAW